MDGWVVSSVDGLCAISMWASKRIWLVEMVWRASVTFCRGRRIEAGGSPACRFRVVGHGGVPCLQMGVNEGFLCFIRLMTHKAT
jgi:hypothetical protein